MEKKLNGLIFASILLPLVFGLMACSASKENKPMGSTQAAKAPASKPSTDVRRTQGSTSLDALKRGAAPVTPANAPMKEIYFAYDKYNLSPEARATLKVNGNWLRKNPAARVEIEGHCDERGTSEYNLALGAKRAQTAKDYLVSLGVAASRISTMSYGEETPVCREHNESCWGRNRRDRFVALTPKPGV